MVLYQIIINYLKFLRKKKIINTDDLNSSSDDSIYNTKTDSSTSTFIN